MGIIAENVNILQKKSLNLSCLPRKDTTLLKVTLTGNEIGIIYRVAAVLYSHGWDILEAIAETSEEGNILDVFVIRSLNNQVMTDTSLREIRVDLNTLFYERKSVIEYMGERGILMDELQRIPDMTAFVKLYNPVLSDFTVVDIQMKDRPGILFQITQILHLFEIDIFTFSAITQGGIIRDSFLIRDRSGNKLDEKFQLPQLKSAIENIL